ncbi:RNA-guided endonuclease IscB [Clostridium botulinum]
MRVFVKNQRRQNLMPCSQRKARILLKQNKAKIISYNPFTIQLLYATGETTQKCNLGIDSGAKNIGFAITSQNKVLVKGEIELRQDIKENITTKRTLRKSRRNRKTRYRKCRFLNRKRRDCWLPPSIQSRVDNQINWIEKFKSLLPNCNLTIEVGKFDTARLINTEIEGVQYQEGSLYGYENIKAYLIARENNKCQICDKEYDGNGWHIHHIKQRKDGGTNRVDNFALVHNQCHIDFHQGKIPNFKFKKCKDYKETTFMNILRQQIFKRLNCNISYGSYTKVDRNNLNLEKTHYNDAIAISGIQEIKENFNEWLKIKQFRKKKRSLHESIPRKGRKVPNITQKRNNKNTKYSKGFYLNDKVKLFDKIGWISGFCNGGCYIKDIEGNYITIPNKKYKQVSYKNLELICHNNNWQWSFIGTV